MKSILSSTIIALSLTRRCSSAFLSTAGTSRALYSGMNSIHSFGSTTTTTTSASRISKLQMSSSPQPPQIVRIDKPQMNEIIDEAESSESSNYVVIDVRNVDEINYTGKLSPSVHTLPLPYIAQYGVFNLDADEFEEQFGFAKPELDQTIVFTCKAGIRSMHAGQFAIQAGYTDIISYNGGSDEWFR
jgi:rhodanese-related sulfurtransferase